MSEDPISVLVIEDNPGDVRLIEAALCDNGQPQFKLTPVDRLSMALKRLAAGGIDVVLLDLGLPDSLGLDSFTSVHDHAPDIPIVILSGLDHQGVAGEAMRAGAHFYLVKSQLINERLDEIIVNAIDQQATRRKIQQARIEEQEAQTQAEERRQQLYSLIGTGDPGAPMFPTDATLFALSADYRELALKYVRSMRMEGKRPALEPHEFAQQLAEIRAGGHHVVRLHQRALSDLAPHAIDPGFVEDSRVMLADVMARLVDIYLNAY